MWPSPRKTADLVKFTEEILSGKLSFFHSNFWNNAHDGFLSDQENLLDSLKKSIGFFKFVSNKDGRIPTKRLNCFQTIQVARSDPRVVLIALATRAWKNFF